MESSVDENTILNDEIVSKRGMGFFNGTATFFKLGRFA
jgi:hypothetical protein